MADRAWSAHAYVGPWGVCIEATDSTGECLAETPAQYEGRAAFVLFIASGPRSGCWYAGVAASSVVRDLLVTRADGSAIRVAPVPAGSARLAVFTWAPGDKAVRWAAYSAAGRKLASGLLR